MKLRYYPDGQIDFESTIRIFASEMDTTFGDAVKFLSTRPSLAVASEFLGLEDTKLGTLTQLGRFLDSKGYTPPKTYGDLPNGGMTLHPVRKPRQALEPANTPVTSAPLSAEELGQLRMLSKGKPTEKLAVIVGEGHQRRHEGESTVGTPGTFTLTKEEYLAKRKEMTRADIAKEQQVSAATLVYHLGKWGLKDTIIEQRVLSQMGDAKDEVAAAVEAQPAIDVAMKFTTTPAEAETEDANVPVTNLENESSTYTQHVDSVDKSEASEVIEYITLRLPVRFQGFPTKESGKVGFNRDELVENGLKSLQTVATWVYEDLKEILADDATIVQVENFIQRKVNAV